VYLANEPEKSWNALAFSCIIKLRQMGGVGAAMRPTPILIAIFFAVLSFEPAFAQDKTYTIGTWNLEHFKDGTKRGFPEHKSPKLRARTAADYKFIADTIKGLDVPILALQEINGEEVWVEDEVGDWEEDIQSAELDKLLVHLTGYDYVIGSSGNTQRLAILYDTSRAQINAVYEMNFQNSKVQGKGLFDRQPVFAHFTLLDGGQERNDLVIVNVHLASGQDHHKNHDQAMRMVVQEIDDSRQVEFCIPDNEHDVIIMGDFNASRFSNPKEEFWDEVEANGWDVLGDDDASYQRTRVNGSKIDYIIVTNHTQVLFLGTKGLKGEEISADLATIHTSLAGTTDAQRLEFRKKASDHIPVTVDVKVMADTD
jgi:endonuclease/exonuclease/phosphatase family metal-dependent hydrolase